MHEYTDVWISDYGSTYQADKIGKTLFSYWAE